MADYATLLPLPRDAGLPVRGSDLPAGLPAEAAISETGVQLLAVAARVPDPLIAAFGKIGDPSVAAVHRFARDNAIPVALLLLRPGPDWGGAFIKTNSYAPWPIWIWLNGPRLGQAPVREGGHPRRALDNGLRSCEDPRALERICDRLGSGALKGFLWRWQHRLPSPFTRNDLRAGYTYELAFRQFEVSDTRVFDRPQAGALIGDLTVNFAASTEN